MTTLRKRSPEELLKQVQEEEARECQGRLKIFLGYASGVGKSFRMLDEARRRAEPGQDVAAAAIQPSASEEAEHLLASIEMIPLLPGGAMDLPAILKRRPRVCLIDGLAWDNPPGSKNQYRWQDVNELIAAGISVIATINIQYVTELSEQVTRITGKRVSTTVPRSFLYNADEIVVVDAPPEQMRFSQLREIALLLAADIVDRQLERYLKEHGVAGSFGTQERILVCVTPRATAKTMIESGRRNADRFHGELIAVHVRQPGLSPENQAALDSNLETARKLGAEIAILEGSDPIEAILEFARERGVTQIFAGHGLGLNWWQRLTGGAVGQLIRGAQGMDVRIFPQ